MARWDTNVDAGPSRLLLPVPAIVDVWCRGAGGHCCPLLSPRRCVAHCCSCLGGLAVLGWLLQLRFSCSQSHRRFWWKVVCWKRWRCSYSSQVYVARLSVEIDRDPKSPAAYTTAAGSEQRPRAKERARVETGGGGLDEVCRVTCWSSANKFRVGRGATATSRRLRPATVVININNSREERAGTSLPATARTRSERHDKVHRLSQNEAQHSGIAAPLDMSGARTRHLGIFKNQLNSSSSTLYRYIRAENAPHIRSLTQRVAHSTQQRQFRPHLDAATLLFKGASFHPLPCGKALPWRSVLLSLTSNALVIYLEVLCRLAVLCCHGLVRVKWKNRREGVERRHFIPGTIPRIKCVLSVFFDGLPDRWTDSHCGVMPHI